MRRPTQLATTSGVFQEVVPPKGTKKLLKKWRGPFQITEVHQGGRFYRLSTGRAAHYENIKPHNASSEDWCIPADMQEGDYLIVDPACEVNERGTRDKNDGNEVVDDCDLPLDLELTERVEVDDETLPYAEEDWDCPEQTEIDKGIQPDFPLTMETRQSKRGKNQKKYNPYGEDFVVDRIVVSDVMGLAGGTGRSGDARRNRPCERYGSRLDRRSIRTGSGVRTRSGTDA